MVFLLGCYMIDGGVFVANTISAGHAETQARYSFQPESGAAAHHAADAMASPYSTGDR
jgi:hypothetical protein